MLAKIMIILDTISVTFTSVYYFVESKFNTYK